MMPRKWLRPDKRRPSVPATVIGQHALAAIVGDTERERYLINYLDGPSGGPESAFWLAAAELAVRHYFGSGYDVRAVTALAAEARRISTMGNMEVFSLLDIEAVYRSALGEDNIDLSGIKLVGLDKIRNSMVVLVVLKQAWPELEIRDLIVQAEQITFERGWHLPLAADVLGSA